MSGDANTKSSGSVTAFILGGLFAALAVIAYLLYSSGGELVDKSDVSVEVPGVGSIEGNIDGN